jgi:hypothetical protein
LYQQYLAVQQQTYAVCKDGLPARSFKIIPLQQSSDAIIRRITAVAASAGTDRYITLPPGFGCLKGLIPDILFIQPPALLYQYIRVFILERLFLLFLFQRFHKKLSSPNTVFLIYPG